MAKDPAFLFYPNDYIGGTMGMTFEEKGAYIELLMMQFNRGHMTSHMIGQTVGQLWVKLKDKFVQDENGLWYNVRLELEQKKRKEFTSSRKNNLEGKNQYSKKEKKEGHKVGHMTSHMENENINEDDIVFKEKFKAKIFNSQSRDRCLMNAGRAGIPKDEAAKMLELAFDSFIEKHDNWRDKTPVQFEGYFSKWISNYKPNKNGTATDQAEAFRDYLRKRKGV